MTTLVTINIRTLSTLSHDVLMHTKNAHYGTETQADFQYLYDLTNALHEANVKIDAALYHSKPTVEVTTGTIKFLLEETKAVFEHSVWGIKFNDAEELSEVRAMSQAILQAMEVMEAVDAKDEPKATLKEVAA